MRGVQYHRSGAACATPGLNDVSLLPICICVSVGNNDDSLVAIAPTPLPRRSFPLPFPNNSIAYHTCTAVVDLSCQTFPFELGLLVDLARHNGNNVRSQRETNAILAPKLLLLFHTTVVNYCTYNSRTTTNPKPKTTR
jgi:hypothetical protein